MVAIQIVKALETLIRKSPLDVLVSPHCLLIEKMISKKIQYIFYKTEISIMAKNYAKV